MPGIIPVINVSTAAGRSPDRTKFGAVVLTTASVKIRGKTYVVTNQTVVKVKKRQPGDAFWTGRGSINFDSNFGTPLARRGTRRGVEVTARSSELPARVREFANIDLSALQVGDRGVPATEHPHSPERRSPRSGDIDDTSDVSRGNQPGENEIRDGVPRLRSRTVRRSGVYCGFKFDTMDSFIPKLTFTAGRLR